MVAASALSLRLSNPMNHRNWIPSVITLVATWAAIGMVGIRAEDARPPRRDSLLYVSIEAENDLWGSGDDRHYTHGTRLSFMPACEPPGWLRRICETVRLFEPGTARRVEFSVGQAIFTPEDIRSPNLVERDRPYAGWLYGTASVIALVEESPEQRSANNLDITLGIVGPSARAGQVQTDWHEVIDSPRPEGWDHQLNDEPGIVLTYTRLWERFIALPLNIQAGFAPHFVVAAGNVYTYGGAGTMMRLGLNLRDDLGPSTIKPGFPGAAYFRKKHAWAFYGFAGVEARGVARNIFLDGNTFEDSHRVDKKPLVFDAQVGIALRYKNIRLSVTDVFRSKEFDGQDEISEYGAINVTVLF